jgi:hypothetical protein
MKSNIINLLLWLVFGILLVTGFREANMISRFSKISMRYETAVSGQAAFRAREYSIDKDYWPTFWRESPVVLSVGRGEIHSDAILFSGDAHLIWHAEYIKGSAPGSTDNIGIAVSEALAHRLWGSLNIIGQGAEADGEHRIVRGIFRGDSELALLSFDIDDTSQYWTGAELYGETTHFGSAETFAAASGLGTPDYLLTGGVISFASLLAALPLLIPLTYALILIIKYVRQYYPKRVMPLFFAGLLLFALFLPVLLDALPDWLVPARWSDFSFWSSALKQSGDNLREFLSVTPTLRDVELKLRLLKLIGITFLSACSGLACVFYKELRS